MCKFKVGDFVQIKSWDEMVKEFGVDKWGDIKCQFTFTHQMRPLCGKNLRISKIKPDSKEVRFNDLPVSFNSYNFSVDMIKPMQKKDQQPQIVILTKGKATIARLYLDKQVIKEGVAKCSPEDRFDFLTGAKLAVERLGEPKEPMPMWGGDIVAKRKIECKVCGAEFHADSQAHYLAKEEKGLGGALCGNKTHDAFDCPVCGCQNLVGEHLPACSPQIDEEEPEDK